MPIYGRVSSAIDHTPAPPRPRARRPVEHRQRKPFRRPGLGGGKVPLFVAERNKRGLEVKGAREMPTGPANEAPHRVIDHVEFGEGVVVFPFTNIYGSRIGDGTRIGTFVEIQRGASIGARWGA